MDIRDLSAPLRVHLAQGHERFTTLGNETVDHPEPGEVIFSDANDLVYSSYQRTVRCMSELIADAKIAITHRSGFAFDPSVRVIRAQ